MNCQDTAKLRTPLNEVCQTTDIGCVPIVSGKPDCAPMPDELPIAFDPNTNTLWLFACKTHEWVAFSKFTMCELGALNLDNITNICDTLNIGVNYGGSGECKQGTITLGELAERILECLKLERKIITIGEGDGNKVKISIEGLPIEPTYVQGRNIWSEGGSGTETDPLIVATYDPICKWPVKTQAQVDASGEKHLGACLDGEMSRVPYPLSPCSYPQITPEEFIGAADKDFIVCVNGENLKVPVPNNLYDPPVCAAPNLTLEEAQAAQGTLKLVACRADGDFSQTVKIPISGSGFFSYNTDWKYLCVPQTNGVPVGAPAEGTGPLRMDCDNTLWVWDCEGSGWRNVIDGIRYTNQIDITSDIPDFCDNLRLKGWDYSNNNVCATPVNFTLKELTDAIELCLGDGKCYNPIRDNSYNNFPFGNNRYVGLRKVTLKNLQSDDFDTFGKYVAVYNVRGRRWDIAGGSKKEAFEDDTDQVKNAADIIWGVKKSEIEEDGGKKSFPIENPYKCRAFYRIRNAVQLYQRSQDYNSDFCVSVVAICSKNSGVIHWNDIPDVHLEWGGSEKGSAPTRRFAVVNWYSKSNGNNGPWANASSLTVRDEGLSPLMCTGSLDPGESVNIHMHCFLVITSKSDVLSEVNLVQGFGSYCDVELIRGVRI